MNSWYIPGGRGEWFSDLRDTKFEDLFGFVKALVVCPPDIHKPFLPYRDNSGLLIFPTGLFVGTYFSEELKFAVDLGYKV